MVVLWVVGALLYLLMGAILTNLLALDEVPDAMMAVLLWPVLVVVIAGDWIAEKIKELFRR